jgi:integrase
MPLDIKTLESLKPRAKSYRVVAGPRLLLQISPKGAKTWLARVSVDGKRKDIGLGGYPVVSLKEAREAARLAAGEARKGIDPAEARQAARAERERQREAIKAARDDTFAAVAERCIAALEPSFKNPRTGDMWRSSLRLHAAPLAKMPVAEIDREAVRATIEDIWQERPVIAKKTLRRIGAVLRYAAAHNLRPNDDPANLRILRLAGLAPQAGGQKQPSLPWKNGPAFMAALDGMAGLAPLALRLLILTALRSGEVRGARWSEIAFDGAGAVWTVPAARMKGKRSAETAPHRVPLSPEALATLARAYTDATGAPATVDDLPRLARLMGDGLIFPNVRKTAALSDMALSAVLKRMNAARAKGAPAPWRDADGREAVPHGFRAAFSTWVDDTCPGEREAAEKALAHEIASKVSGAYRRSDLLDRRIPLMAEWAKHCASGQPSAVVTLPGKRAAAER